MYPLKFHPVYKDKIWGGDALARLFGRQLPSSKVGESWDIAAHPNGQSVVSNGRFAGTQLVDLLQSHRDEIMGRTPMGERDQFPLLVKLLDCNDWLSVQVHPDDEYARKYENGELGKTETWVVLHAEPGAQIVYGAKPGTTRETFAEAIKENRVEEFLQKVSVKVGDVYSVPAGTLHALGRGVVVAEIQQNSDTVYRVYDWGRLGDDGKPRELHIDKALEVIDFSREVPTKGASLGPTHSLAGVSGMCQRTFLDANEKYVIERIDLTGRWSPVDDNRCFIFMALQGQCTVKGGGEELLLKPGDSILVPAAVTDLSLDGSAVLLRSFVPDLNEDVVKPLVELGVDRHQLEMTLGLKEE